MSLADIRAKFEAANSPQKSPINHESDGPMFVFHFYFTSFNFSNLKKKKKKKKIIVFEKKKKKGKNRRKNRLYRFESTIVGVGLNKIDDFFVLIRDFFSPNNT